MCCCKSHFDRQPHRATYHQNRRQKQDALQRSALAAAELAPLSYCKEACLTDQNVLHACILCNQQHLLVTCRELADNIWLWLALSCCFHRTQKLPTAGAHRGMWKQLPAGSSHPGRFNSRGTGGNCNSLERSRRGLSWDVEGKGLGTTRQHFQGSSSRKRGVIRQ